MSDIFTAGETLSARDLNTFVQSGEVPVFISGDIRGGAEIEFPVPFDGAPRIVASVGYGSFGVSVNASTYGVRLGNISPTGAHVHIYRVDSSTLLNGTFTVQWIAHGRPGPTI